MARMTNKTSKRESNHRLLQSLQKGVAVPKAPETLAMLLLALTPATLFHRCGLERIKLRTCLQQISGDGTSNVFLPQDSCTDKRSSRRFGVCGASGGRAQFKTVKIPLREGSEISARVYTPERPPIAAVVFVHGGCFTLGDETADEDVCRALSGQNCGGNLVVVAPNYRQGVQHPHETGRAIADLEDAVKFAREKAAPGLPLGVIGCSSGGYFALKLARDLKEHPVDFVVGVCPVAHPGLRADYLVACTLSAGGRWVQEGLSSKMVNGSSSVGALESPPFHNPQFAALWMGMQDGYFAGDRAAMHAAGNELEQVPAFAEGCKPPPVLLILGDADKNVPLRVVAGVRRCATRELVLPGRGHDICQRLPQEVEEAIREFVGQALMTS